MTPIAENICASCVSPGKGKFWVEAMEFWANLAHDLMRLKPNNLPQ
ncbi:hypothetical protein JYQ62_17925 [Nostoc sp. UHCC 0702]|nr:hypothetical protein JYQ62_17925 [Nostoc sp. UHCC 0702]